jgi:DNA-binding beta-propeller fold protein YncE
VLVFKPGVQKPYRTITSGISDPVALAVDVSGNLFVANVLDNTISIYSPGDSPQLGKLRME